MTNVRATCSFGCGDIKIPSSFFTIRTRAGEPGGQYRFTCPVCHKIVLKNATEQIIQVLRDSDVVEEIWELPLEMIEHPADGTLDEDDLIDLYLADEEGDLFDRITRKPDGLF